MRVSDAGGACVQHRLAQHQQALRHVEQPAAQRHPRQRVAKVVAAARQLQIAAKVGTGQIR